MNSSVKRNLIWQMFCSKILYLASGYNLDRVELQISFNEQTPINFESPFFTIRISHKQQI